MNTISRKKLAVAAILVLILALSAMGMWAAFTAEGRATNIITTGTVDLTLTEEGSGTPIQDENGVTIGLKYDNVMPGDVVSKKPIVTNTGTGDFYTRVKAEISAKSASGADLDTSAVTIKLNDGWVEKDGWYYYTEAVAPEAQVSPFQDVNFSSSMGNEYQSATVTITLQAQAVQTANNPIPEGGSVTSVTGWPE